MLVVDGDAGYSLPPILLGELYAIGVRQVEKGKTERVGNGCVAYDPRASNGKCRACRGSDSAGFTKRKVIIAQKFFQADIAGRSAGAVFIKLA